MPEICSDNEKPTQKAQFNHFAMAIRKMGGRHWKSEIPCCRGGLFHKVGRSRSPSHHHNRERDKVLVELGHMPIRYTTCLHHLSENCINNVDIVPLAVGTTNVDDDPVVLYLGYYD
jgi:hypothetical protein